MLEDRFAPTVSTQLFLSAGATGGPQGAIINVAVNLSNATGGLSSGDINITYDASRLSIPADSSILHGSGTVTGTEGGNGAFTNFTVNRQDSAGQLHVGFFDTTGANGWTGTQALFTINFTIQSHAPQGLAPINIQATGTANSLVPTELYQNNSQQYALSPAPGDTSNNTSISVLYPSATALTSSAHATVTGQTVSLTATVTASGVMPTGTVTYLDSGVSLGTSALNASAVASLSTSTLAASTHSITAVYSGDNDYSNSTSSPLSQTVGKGSTVTSLSSSLNPATLGQSVNFTATVTAVSPASGVPAGTVTFLDGSTSLGSQTVSGNGTATFTTSSLSLGAHQISIVYGGSSNFLGSTSPTSTETINPVTFRVASFSSTSTGFQATFNRAFSVGTPSNPIINLYDDTSGLLGAADVTLVGSTTGSIRGSLVIDQNNTHMAFIQTGQTGVGPAAHKGVLPNDTYTVTLRSAANGFQDTNGNLLDGTNSGTPGSNFVTTFIINNPSSSVTVTLPDFARGPGQTVNLPNSATGIPLRILNNASTGQTITSATLTLAYNSSLLNVTPVSNSTLTITTNTSTPNLGLAFITLNPAVPIPLTASSVTTPFTGSTTLNSPTVAVLSTTGLSVGQAVTGSGILDGTTITGVGTNSISLSQNATVTASNVSLTALSNATILTLTASVPSTAGYGAKELLDLQNIQINGGSITGIDDAAIHVVGFLGDATGDDIYTGLDAQRLARVAVGIDPGFRQWILADPTITGDANGDNQLTGLDALGVARQAVGLTQSHIPPLPTVTPAITGPDPILSIGTPEVRGQRSEVGNSAPANSSLASDFRPLTSVAVPVNLDHAAGLDSVSLAISYDTSRLDVTSAADVLRGSLTQSFDSFTVNIDRAAGIIRIIGYSNELRAQASGGSLAVINFHIRADAQAGPAFVNLLQNVGSTWSLPGGTDARGNDFLFDLEPKLSNLPGSPLDGVINVTPIALDASANTVSPETPALAAESTIDAAQHPIIALMVDAPDLARLLQSPINTTTNGSVVNADSGPTTLPIGAGSELPPAVFRSTSRLYEVVYSARSLADKVPERMLDDFFSQYSTTGPNGIVDGNESLLDAETSAFIINGDGQAISEYLALLYE